MLAKQVTLTAAIAFVVFLQVSAVDMGRGVELYVATNGSDANAGTEESPFRSLEGARDAIRRLKEAGSLKEPVTVWIRGGLYHRTHTFQLTQEDSGTKESPVTYRAYGKETVRLVGGEELPASWFEPVKDPGVLRRLEKGVRGKVLQVNLREHGITDYGELGSLAGGLKLFRNGKRMQLARWPNEGWALARSAKAVGLDEDAAARLAKQGKLGKILAFKYSGDSPNLWGTLEAVWLRGYWQQEYQYDGWNPVGFDRERREILLGWRAPPHLQTWRRFFAVNVLEEVDQPGEWYLDRKKGILYFLPPEDFRKGPLLASMLQEAMVSLDNTSYITIRGLTLEVMRGLAIVVGAGQHNRIAGCVIRHASQGVILAGGKENGVVGCDIYDLDAMGIRMSGGDRKTLAPAGLCAINNHIHHYARCLKTWYPGVKIQGVGNRVAHNLIHDAPHQAIGYDGNDHLIELNEIHDVVLESSDAGVLYTGRDWTFRGNVVRYNFIHHIPFRPGFGSKVVYLDDCASSTEIFGNVFYETRESAFIGGGRDNIVQNNIFIECEQPVHLDTRGLTWDHFRPGGPMYEPLKRFRIKQPPWSMRYPKLARILEEHPQAPLGNVVVNNVSYRSSWHDPDRKYIKVADNFITDEDPGFVDAAKMNFQLKDDSIVYRKIPVFKKIRFDKIGLYQDEFRATWPVSKGRP